MRTPGCLGISKLRLQIVEAANLFRRLAACAAALPRSPVLACGAILFVGRRRLVLARREPDRVEDLLRCFRYLVHLKCSNNGLGVHSR